jgi:multidrug resistance efflux pump
MGPRLKKSLANIGRVLATLVVVIAAGIAAYFAWQYYVYAPWTRDARVQANVINMAPNVGGTVVKVGVTDDSTVHKGALLFRIDPTRYRHSVAHRKAVLAKDKAEADYQEKNAKRLEKLPKGAVSTQKVQLAQSKAASAKASIQVAKAQLAQAKQNLAWTTVRAPADAYVTHLLLNEGDYVSEGTQSITIVKAKSVHVTAYFQETKLSKIAIGDPADIKLMAGGRKLHGHVSGIGYGIAIKNNAKGERNLPNVNPTFQWVRLAQRIPVKIKFDHPRHVGRLSIGMTATVHLKSEPHASKHHKRHNHSSSRDS